MPGEYKRKLVFLNDSFLPGTIELRFYPIDNEQCVGTPNVVFQNSEIFIPHTSNNFIWKRRPGIDVLPEGFDTCICLLPKTANEICNTIYEVPEILSIPENILRDYLFYGELFDLTDYGTDQDKHTKEMFAFLNNTLDPDCSFRFGFLGLDQETILSDMFNDPVGTTCYTQEGVPCQKIKYINVHLEDSPPYVPNLRLIIRFTVTVGGVFYLSLRIDTPMEIDPEFSYEFCTFLYTSPTVTGEYTLVSTGVYSLYLPPVHEWHGVAPNPKDNDFPRDKLPLFGALFNVWPDTITVTESA